MGTPVHASRDVTRQPPIDSTRRPPEPRVTVALNTGAEEPVRKRGVAADWGRMLFFVMLAIVLVFFWWLLIHSGGVVGTHG